MSNEDRAWLSVRGSLSQYAQQLDRLSQQTARDLWEMGRILSEAQKELAAHGTGRFKKWVEDETTLSVRTAYRLLDIHKAFDCATLAQSNIATSALYLLSAPSAPPAARVEAIRQAERGETITSAKAQNILRDHQPPPAPPEPTPPSREYQRFEREKLRPQLQDAGLPAAPQILSGRSKETEPRPGASEPRGSGLRDAVVEQLAACRDGKEIEACADEILEALGQTSGSIAIAAHFGVALASGPKTLSDLTTITIETCGACQGQMERDEYLRWRKRTLRLVDALSYLRYEGGCLLYEHTLKNGQIAYGLADADVPT